MRFLVVLVVAVVFAGAASGAMVAQLDGPTSYSPNQDPVLLSDVTIGDEGSIDLEFRANASTGCLWYLGDVFGGSVGEYRLQLAADTFQAIVWNSGTYCASWTTPFTDTADWHSVRLAWKDGYDTLITFDGATESVTNAGPLYDFTSGPGIHKLGGYPSQTLPFPYTGDIRNVKVYDTYEESASVVAQHDGPTTFGGGVQTLPDVTIGDEGTIELEFMADDVSGCIWYMADVVGGSEGEYRILLGDDTLRGILWNHGSYATDVSIPFTDTTEWHSLKMTWKEGEETLFTLDGVTTSATNSVPLGDFASGAGIHAMGGYPNGFAGGNYFTGMTRNVKIYDTYNPSSGLQGDLNGDGMVGSADLDIVRANWGATVPGGDLMQGDPSGDGVVGSADLDIVRANWGSTGAASVPEPGVFLMLAIGLIGATLGRAMRRP